MLGLMVAVILGACTKDIECKGTRICEAGKCVTPVDADFAVQSWVPSPPPPPPQVEAQEAQAAVPVPQATKRAPLVPGWQTGACKQPFDADGKLKSFCRVPN